MNRRYCLVFGVLVLSSCSSTDAPAPAVAGASAIAGAATAGGPAGGSSGASNPGGSAGLTSTAGTAGALVAGAGGASSGAGGASGGAGGASGASSGAAGASGASGGASGASGGSGGSAGKGGAGGNAGSAGAAAKYCDGKTLSPSPVIVTDRFDDEYVGADLGRITEFAAPDVCDEQPEANAVGSCGEWRYTPGAAGGIVGKQWKSDPAGIKYAPVCMAAGMTKVTFRAKGYAGDEVVTFGASQAKSVDVPLTNAWAPYSISLTNVTYNSASQGVQPGFSWSVDPTKNPGKDNIRFALDDIQYVNN